MAAGAGSSVLIAAPAGIYEASRGADGSFSTHPYPLPTALARKPMHGILRQGERLWFGCGQQLCMEQAGQVSVFGTEQGLPEDAWDAIQVSPDGTVWVRSAKSLYIRAGGTGPVLAGEVRHRIERVLGSADVGPRTVPSWSQPTGAWQSTPKRGGAS